MRLTFFSIYIDKYFYFIIIIYLNPKFYTPLFKNFLILLYNLNAMGFT
jgi:hypothetical protein